MHPTSMYDTPFPINQRLIKGDKGFEFSGLDRKSFSFDLDVPRVAF